MSGYQSLIWMQNTAPAQKRLNNGPCSRRLAVLASELCNGGTPHGWRIRSRDKRKARSAGLIKIIGWAQLVKGWDGWTIHKSLEQAQEFRPNVLMIRYMLMYIFHQSLSQGMVCFVWVYGYFVWSNMYLKKKKLYMMSSH